MTEMRIYMKNKKIINVICYIITAALAVFYLATLVLGSKRQVSQEYDLYYVDPASMQ